MRRGWVVGVGVALACGGGPDLEVPSAPASKPLELPASLQSILPSRPPFAVDEAAWARGRGEFRLRRAGTVDALYAEILASCAAHGSCVAAAHEGAVVLLHAPADEPHEVVRVEGVQSGDEVVLAMSVGVVAGDVPWPDGAWCGPHRLPAVRTLPDGSIEHVCSIQDRDDGRVRRDGPYRRALGGVDVLSGAHADGRRDGPWTLRGLDGVTRSEGRFTAGEPTGSWRFGGQEVVYDAGVPTPPVSWVELVGDRGVLLDTREWSLEVLDADLTTGRVALRIVYEDSGHLPVRDCAYPGLAGSQGVQLVLLDAGIRAPIGAWTVYASVPEDEPCTTEAQARESLAAAKAALASHGLDPSRRHALVPLADGMLQVGERVVRVEEIPGGLDDLVAMGIPDTVGGGFEASRGHMRTRGRRVTIDGVEVQQVWFRGEAYCGGSEGPDVAGAVVQGDRFALVWTGEHGSCAGSTLSALVGPVW